MKVWFVTGASRGFGAEIVAGVLRAGDAVVATARDPSDIVRKFGSHPRLLAAELDVTQPRQASLAVEAAINRFSRIDVLVNNAGYGLVGAVEEATADEIADIFDTNVFGLLAVCRAVLPTMRKQRSGHVINISSRGGYGSYPGWGVYCATKFAVEALTESFYAELRPLGIHATVVQPGSFRTGFHDSHSLQRSTEIGDYSEILDAVRVAASAKNETRPGDPRKLADAIITLASAADPPLRLPMGIDTIARIEEKHRHVVAEIQQWRMISESTGG